MSNGIPEALGCPPELVLTDVACAPCNNGLAYLDQALVRQFEPITFALGLPRKGGRPPTIAGWAALRGDHYDGGPRLLLNGGPGAVEVEGRTLRPASRANGITGV